MHATNQSGEQSIAAVCKTWCEYMSGRLARGAHVQSIFISENHMPYVD